MVKEQFYLKKFLGQHFLHDQKVIEQLVAFIAPDFSDKLIEIGPGAGALTSKLLPLVSSMDAIEIDREVLPLLKINCQNSEKLFIHEADVLHIDLTKFKAPIRLIGNLPYNISTPLLFKAIEHIEAVHDMHFMLQKEVAERIVAVPGSKTYGRLSVMLQYYCEATMLLHVSPGSFSPPPKVHSAFIRLIPRKKYLTVASDKLFFSEVVRMAFNHRRKIISNSLKGYITPIKLEKININPLARPEQLYVNDFVNISNAVLIDRANTTKFL